MSCEPWDREYLPNWHIDAIVHRLMLAQSGKVTRLIVNEPPRSLKSICTSVAFVAWLLGHDPSLRIIVASYSQDFAGELHRQFRRVIETFILVQSPVPADACRKR